MLENITKKIAAVFPGTAINIAQAIVAEHFKNKSTLQSQ